MCHIKRMSAILFILCFLLASCTPRYSDNAKNTTLLIRQWLDSNGFDHTMSQITMEQKLENVTHNGKPIADDLYDLYFDGPYGGGVMSSGENYGYSDNWQGKDHVANYAASFYSRVNLTGLPLPFDLKIGSSMHELLSLFDASALYFSSSAEITLCELENLTVLSKYDSFAEHPYCIEWIQNYRFRNSSDVTVRVIRTASFRYSEAKTLQEFSVSIEATYPLR